MTDAIKYPKTPRLSAVLKEDVHETWKRLTAVVEEKVDGANVGVWFEGDALRLQSRGHVLRGGPGEAQFSLLHSWAAERRSVLWERLGTDRVLYGEWCYAKHRAYYDALPDWLLALDVLDREADRFLSTPDRDEVFRAVRARGAPRLWTGPFGKAPAFASFLGPSRLKTKNWRTVLDREAAQAKAGNVVWPVTDDSDWMEGVYVRVEDATGVVGRMKLHREGFEKVRSDDWGPIVRNTLTRHQT